MRRLIIGGLPAAARAQTKVTIVLDNIYSTATRSADTIAGS